jgi:hypothetical protein
MAINTPRPDSQPPVPTGARRAFMHAGRWLVMLVGVASLVVTGTGCAKARAQTVPDGPPLAMPDPPSRVFAPVEEEPLVSSPVAPDAPATSAPRVTVTRPPVRRPTPAEAEKPEPTPPAPAPAPVAEAPRELRAASSPADPEAERRIGDLIARAARDLNRVDYRRLTLGGKEQYDQAKSFSEEAEKALKERNFVYAQTAAEKSAKLATELLGR